MWISKKFGIFVRSWKFSKNAPKDGPFFGKVSWSNKSLKGTSYYDLPKWSLSFWMGRRMVHITRNWV